jgi:hypothetical protein
MRFLCIYKPGTAEGDCGPSERELGAMAKLIEEMARAGVLLATEGCLPSATGARVRIQAGEYTVTDGPFPETKELIAGFCLIQVKSKAEAIEWTKRFLSVVGTGESEIRQVYEAPAYTS